MNQADWLRKRWRTARKPGCAAEIGGLILVALTAAHLIGEAQAAGDSMAESTGAAPQKTLGDYFTDLASDDAPERLFAARAVRAEAFGALRTLERAPADSLASMEARSLLVEIDARLPGACRSALRYENTVVPGAEMLAATGRTEMLPEVQAASHLVKPRGLRKRYDAAVVKLGGGLTAGAPEAEPAPAAAPAPLPAPSPASPPPTGDEPQAAPSP